MFAVTLLYHDMKTAIQALWMTLIYHSFFAMSNIYIELPEIPSIPSIDNQSKHEDVKPMDVPNNEPVMANKPEKKQYDVEEILNKYKN